MKIIQSRANKETSNNHFNNNKRGNKKWSFEVHENSIYRNVYIQNLSNSGKNLEKMLLHKMKTKPKKNL
jgi:hypothetical protein